MGITTGCNDSPQRLTIAVEPAGSELAPLVLYPETQTQFAATLGGSLDGRVTWSIIAPPGLAKGAEGRIAEDGVYTAPTHVPLDPLNGIRIRATAYRDAATFADTFVSFSLPPVSPRTGPSVGQTLVRIDLRRSIAPSELQSLTFGDMPAEVVNWVGGRSLDVVAPRHEIGMVPITIRYTDNTIDHYPSAYRYHASTLELGRSRPFEPCTGITAEARFVDLDGCGPKEIVALCEDGSSLVVEFVNEDGTWRERREFAIPSAVLPYMTVGDGDGDGDTDVFITGYGVTPVGVQILRNRGANPDELCEWAGFDDVTIAPTTGLALLGSIVDVTGDGLPDAVGVTQDLKVFPGSATGMFAGTEIIVEDGSGRGNRFLMARAGDINGDGSADIVAANNPSGIVSYLNDGAGAFTALPDQSLSFIRDIALANLDSDPGMEVIVSESPFFALNPMIIVYKYNATTNTLDRFMDLDYGYVPGKLWLQDFTGDGLTDIVYELGYGLRVLPGPIDATTQSLEYHLTGIPLDVADLSGDGVAEIVGTRYSRYDAAPLSDTGLVLEAFTDVTQSETTYDLPRIGSLESTPSALLFDRDEITGAVRIAALDGGSAQVFHQSAGDSWSPLQQIDVRADQLRYAQLTQGNGKDLISFDANSISVILATPNGYESPMRVPFTPLGGGTRISDIEAEDFDGDGRSDLLVSYETPDDGANSFRSGGLQFVWGPENWRNLGPGVPVKTHNVPASSIGGLRDSLSASILMSDMPITHTIISDLNLDGAREVVAISAPRKRLMLLGAGLEGSSDVDTYNLPYVPRKILADDINGDRFLDVVVLGSDRISVFYSDAHAKLQLPNEYLGASGDDIVSADMNGDGFQDLALSHFGCISLFLGTESGRLRDPLLVSSGRYSGVLAVAQWKPHELPSFIVTDVFDNSIRLARNRSR